MVAKSSQAKKDKDGKPDVTLEFAQREVVAPQLMAMPTVIEFSGPLVAPQTAIVRAKALPSCPLSVFARAWCSSFKERIPFVPRRLRRPPASGAAPVSILSAGDRIRGPGAELSVFY